jgi:subtilisin family serine protease
VLFVGAADSGLTGVESLLHQPGVIEVASEESYTRAALIYAPGREILTLMPGGHYDFATGDSIATAQVTGVVALLLEKNHGLSAAAAGQVLRETSTRAAAMGAAGSAGASEHVDACGAVVALMGRGSCPGAAAAARAAPETRVALH